MPSVRSSFALQSMLQKKVENNMGAITHPCLDFAWDLQSKCFIFAHLLNMMRVFSGPNSNLRCRYNVALSTPPPHSAMNY